MKTLVKPAKKKARAAHAKELPSIFTARDLNRQPAVILKACDKFGSVRIQTRDGRAYELRNARPAEKPAALALRGKIDFPALWRQLRVAGCVPPTAAETERIHRIIAGEI